MQFLGHFYRYGNEIERKMALSSQYFKNALAIGSAKEAAVYFDVVIPFDLSAGMTARELDQSIACDTKRSDILHSLLPEVKDVESFYRGYEGSCNAFWGVVALSKWKEENGSTKDFMDQDVRYIEFLEECMKLTFDKTVQEMMREIDQESGSGCPKKYRDRCNSMLNNGFESLQIDAYSTWYDQTYEWPASDETDDSTNEANIVVTLQNFDLVDPERLAWSKILKLREDKKAQSALRDLRLFLYSNLSGMDQEMILNMLYSRYEKFCNATRWWKLDTVKKSLSLIVSKEGLAATSVGALVSIMLGAPIDPLSFEAIREVIAAGAVFNVGASTSLGLAEAMINKEKLEQTNGSEVRYFSRLPKKHKSV